MASILKTDKIEGVTSSGTVQMPAGHVIQTVITASSSDIDTTSSSFVATGLIVSITPKFSNSKIVITWSGNFYINQDNGHGYFQFYRDSTALGHSTEGNRLYQAGDDGKARWQSVTIVHLDEPNTTSTVTYKIYIKSNASSATFRICYGTNYYSDFTLQEIRV